MEVPTFVARRGEDCFRKLLVVARNRDFLTRFEKWVARRWVARMRVVTRGCSQPLERLVEASNPRTGAERGAAVGGGAVGELARLLEGHVLRQGAEQPAEPRVARAGGVDRFDLVG